MSEINLTSYREIAAGTTGAFMAPADVAMLLSEIDRLRKALTEIETGTILQFEESEEREVEVWMDAEDMQEIARQALATLASQDRAAEVRP